jgi:hypothetical protein
MLVVQFPCADHEDEEALNSINIISQIIIPIGFLDRDPPASPIKIIIISFNR